MDILEEIDVFLNACQLTQDESNNLVFNGKTGCFEPKHLADWFVNQINFGWKLWQAAKAQAVPEKDAVIKKLSDQLYEQEMKTSAARVLCETACELLDDYAHQDAMVILNDLEQAMNTGASQ